MTSTELSTEVLADVAESSHGIKEIVMNFLNNFATNIVTFLGFAPDAANYVYVFLISMVPIIELRGAIPVGTAIPGLNPFIVYIVAVLGNILPVPFILLLITPFCRLLKKTKLFRWFPEWLERKVAKNKNKVTKYDENVQSEKKKKRAVIKKYLGLFIFVAIPLPGTGAWTGALVASFIGYKFRDAFITISLGVIAAGVLMTAGSTLVEFIISLF